MLTAMRLRRHLETGQLSQLASCKVGAMEREEISRLVRTGPISMENPEAASRRNDVAGAQCAITQQLFEAGHLTNLPRAKGGLHRPAPRSILVAGALLNAIDVVPDIRNSGLSRRLVTMDRGIGEDRSRPPELPTRSLSHRIMVGSRACRSLVKAEKIIKKIGFGCVRRQRGAKHQTGKCADDGIPNTLARVHGLHVNTHKRELPIA
jgi:hypothetical protein